MIFKDTLTFSCLGINGRPLLAPEIPCCLLAVCCSAESASRKFATQGLRNQTLKKRPVQCKGAAAVEQEKNEKFVRREADVWAGASRNKFVLGKLNLFSFVSF